MTCWAGPLRWERKSCLRVRRTLVQGGLARCSRGATLETGSSRIEPRRHAGRFGRVICHSQVEVFRPRPHPVSATRAESGACKRNRPSGHACFGARRARRAASQSATSVGGRLTTSVEGRTKGHDQGDWTYRGASRGAAGVSASGGACTKSTVRLAELWGPSLFGEVVAEAATPRECDANVPAFAHPRGVIHGALREEVTSGRFGGRSVGGSPGPLATVRAILGRADVMWLILWDRSVTTVR